ncbi:hypothetical protein GH714_011144 [Hevea brasiliensis]|uniref:Microtubule-associated protein 70-5 n=1 Tax=Hevea brasiliensis TaxID=3981 RepID=A0A6A6M144_HEVBR|nr:hypothetical protein GH714_011144 [Hevea brasiliensis]
MVGYEEQLLPGGEQLSLSQPDPFVIELNRLQNLHKGELLIWTTAEFGFLTLGNDVNKLDQKIRDTENLLEHKNLEIKKLTNEKKDALAAQYAAESTLRRLHANLKDDDSLPIESFIAPLEAEIKIYKSEIAALHEDKKAMERLNKSKESALLEAERILRSALERALMVEEVQNQNYELKRQIEICQEENRILEKTNRQKVLEVERLSQTIQELEEAILAGGVAANTIRDYKRQISEINEEKRLLERELARAKVSANRVATVVANEWKDENDKVMPVKQWLEERRLLQVLFLNRITPLQDKLMLRLKTLEEGLKHVSSFSINSPKPAKTSNILGFLSSNGGLRKRSSSQPRASTISRSTPLQQPNIENENANAARELKRADSFKKKYCSAENKLRNSLWASRSKVTDSNGKENTELMANTDANIDKYEKDETTISTEMKNKAVAMRTYIVWELKILNVKM